MSSKVPLVPLSTIAHGRSGDKGNHANVAVIAYTPAGFTWLRRHLTAEVVQRYFAPLGLARVERFEAANLLALNFMLYDVLAGGASRSPRSDNQGKTLALALLRMGIEAPADLEAMKRPTRGLGDRASTPATREGRP
jgi:hypothetical protein